MSLYVVNSDSLEIENACERSSVISLLTDRPEDLPCALRDASDHVRTTDFSILWENQLPEGADAAFIWMAGEKLLEGSALGLRRALFAPGRRSFVAAHLPCLPELDLISLLPRLWKKGEPGDVTQPDFRVAATPTPPPQVLAYLEESPEIWARLHAALLAGQKSPDSSVERMSQLWQDSTAIPKAFASLLLRNLIVLLIRYNQREHAEKLLKTGMEYYPRYAELPYLAALLSTAQGRYSEVFRYARHASKNIDPSFIGSGGEYSYRTAWLLGLANELAGKQLLAVQCYLIGAQARPAYPPSVFGILRQRLPYRAVQNLQYNVLGSLARRESQYLEPIFHFFLLHRQVEPARRLLELSSMPDDQRHKLQKLFDATANAFRPAPRPGQAKPGVMLVGPFWICSSLARVNRETGAALMAADDLDGALEPESFCESPGASLPHFALISKGLRKQVKQLDLTIRHHWPPDFTRPASGKLVSIFPWEFGSVPRKWVEQIEKYVDELWTPSEFCRDVYIRAGVSASRVYTIPSGIDTEIFKPQGARWRPEGCRSFVFLFVGGTIPRKGIDLLLEAYRKVFTPKEDVTLVVKDMGSSSFYKDMTLIEDLTRATQDLRAPHLVILPDDLSDEKLAELYRGCDVFVLPYRGEGFGLPLAEALACGKPVITTGLGPAREFCPPEASYFLSAQIAEVPSARLRFGPLSGPFTWFEPDIRELARTLRHVFEHREEASERGTAAAEKVQTALSWRRITGLQLKRVRHLVA
ncbi:MAG: glycosyltransferase family 4 protein [Terriglobia bacterium]